MICGQRSSLKLSVLLSIASLILWGCSHKPTPVETGGSGPSLFAVNCAICHGANGKGDGLAAPSMKPPPPPLDSQFLLSRQRSHLETVVRQGVTRDGRQTMPPAGELTDAEVNRLVDYLFVIARENEVPK